MSFTIRCHGTFEAAHHLRDYVGGPEPVHGHSWKIEVALETAALGAYDLSVDFVPTEKLVRELASRLHDRDVNTVPPFDVKNPTAENIALWVADEIAASGALTGGARLAEVTVWEGPRNSVTYRPAAAPRARPL
jgi:6-pyruvoyltetrahydropterin/6-carboxytetrahydropterin synthase